MFIIHYEETLEQKERREHNIPSHVKTEDIPSYIGRKSAEMALKEVREILKGNS